MVYYQNCQNDTAHGLKNVGKFETGNLSLNGKQADIKGIENDAGDYRKYRYGKEKDEHMFSAQGFCYNTKGSQISCRSGYEEHNNRP